MPIRGIHGRLQHAKEILYHYYTQCYGLYTTSVLASKDKLDCLSGEFHIDFETQKSRSTGLNYYMLIDNANEIVIDEIELTPENYSSHHKCISLSDYFELIVFDTRREFTNSFQMTVHVYGNQIIPEVSIGVEKKIFLLATLIIL